jgi:hypothetical protein
VHDLVDPDRDAPVRSSVISSRDHARADRGELAGPVLADGGASVDVAAQPAVCPNDVLGEPVQHALDVAPVERRAQTTDLLLLRLRDWLAGVSAPGGFR